ncbi:MAG TPA: hypothetical protein VIY48_02925, partial [Candidatus Paceibacterota bacterium]
VTSAVVTGPLSFSGNTLSIAQATASTNGYLASTDFTTFNNKISSTSLSAGAGIAYNSSTGVITNTIGYPFVGNATTTQLAFNGGLTAVGATTTALAVTGSSTISSILNVGGVLNANGGVVGSLTGNASTATTLQTARNINGVLFNGSADITIFAASSTLLADSNTFSGNNSFTGNTTLAQATSSAFAITGITSSLLKTTASGSVVPAIAGTDYLTSANIFGYPFVGNATTTQLAFNGGATFVGATTTALAVTGSTTISGILNQTGNAYFGGNVGLGTTTPSAKLDINGDTLIESTHRLSFNTTANYFNADNSGIIMTNNLLFRLSVNGNSALFINSNGNTGVGTSTPLSKFTVSGSASIGADYNTAAPSNGLIVEGTVGIGTTSPFATLSVNGSGFFGSSLTATNLTATGTLSVAGNTTLANATTTNLAISNIVSTLLKTDASGNVIPAVAGTDYLTSATTFAYPFPSNATSTLLNFNGGLTAFASSTIGNGTQGLTINGGATTTGNAYFAGNVGVGTTSPAYPLSVNGNLGITGKFINTRGTTPWELYGSGADFYGGTLTTDLFRFTSSGNGGLSLGAGYISTAAPSGGLLVQGNVGIGTTTPQATLNVQTAPGNYSMLATNSSGINAAALRINSDGSGDFRAFGSGNTLGVYGASALQASGGIYGWTPLATNAATSLDTGISRLSAGVVAIGTGAQGSTAGGIIAAASSTIGDSTQTGGLTISGGATTTGNAYFAGNVGIGTSVPNSKLSVTTSGTSYANIGEVSGVPTYSGIDFSNVSRAVGLSTYSLIGNGSVTIINRPTGGTIDFREANGTDQMTIASGGKVGIGTTTPAGALDVQSAGSASGFFRSSNQYNVVSLDNLSGNASLQNILRFNNNGTVQWSMGNDAANSNALTFSSASLLSSAPRMVITTSGNVGIGTTSPLTKLQIENGNPGITFTPNARTAAIIDGNNSSGTTLSIIGTTTGKVGLFLGSPTNEALGQVTYDNTTNALTFGVNGGGRSFVFSTAGNLGIGTTSPVSTLSVQGNGLFSGNVSFAGLTATGTVKLSTYTNGALAADASGNLYTFATSTWTFASSTLLSDSNTWSGNNTFTNTPILGSLTGLVGSNNGTLYQIATSSNFVTALTAGNGIALSGSTGNITVTNTIGYAFPSNATSTSIAFNGGLTASTLTATN